MPAKNSEENFNKIVGSLSDDEIVTAGNTADHINGHAGSDTLASGEGHGLVAGDMVGKEWGFVNGRWIYNPEAIVSNGDAQSRAYNDIIHAGRGDDVVLGNGGHDQLFSDSGNDTVNAGVG
ncbi:hypothetical protein [Roseovarius sp. EL26]|uniref:hypothetical protein n=1 Tax=Roseovarius sp. EL26 TaxID=2126672 RepID=UPI000EA113C0|nr:hypothetical protein [Roseovarius sp. EL26]